MLYNIYYFIYTFHMPAFFVLSGLLARPSVNKNGEKFFKNIIKNIAYPYFLYGSIQLLVMNVFSNQLNRPAPFDLFEFRYLFIGSPSQFWFLKTLFLMHVAYLISKKYINIHWFLLICITLRGSSELLPIPADLGGSQRFRYILCYRNSLFRRLYRLALPLPLFTSMGWHFWLSLVCLCHRFIERP